VPLYGFARHSVTGSKGKVTAGGGRRTCCFSDTGQYSIS